MQQPQQSGKPPMQRAEFEELVWRLWKEDGSPQLQLHSYMQGAIVMDRHYRSMAPASPVEELPDDLQGWFRDWCKATKRNGGILIGSSIREFIDYLSSKLTESKPPPVIEIGEQKVVSKEEFKEWLNKRDYGGPSAGMYRKGGWDAYVFLTEYPASHPAPAPIVGEREERKYPIGGYAPGNYSCNCVTCKQNFRGDKRAVQCEPCAIKASDPALTEQALPQEVINWIAEEFVKPENALYNYDQYRAGAIAMYHKMREDLRTATIIHEQTGNALQAQIAEAKETLRIATQNESSYRVWLEKSREQLASARDLITKIKRWDVYQEPADECDKWLTDNIETK